MQGSSRVAAALALAVSLAVGYGASAQSSRSQSTDQAQANAKITMKQARETALKAAQGGKIVDQEFEKENGGWRYSFDIREGNRIHEIGVDAETGKIVENSWEGTQDKD